MKGLMGCLRVDLCRAFFSYRFLVGVIGVCGSMIIGIVENIGWNFSVLYVFHMVVYGIPFLAVTFFCAFPFASSICEDCEHKFLSLIVTRESIKSYAASKVITISLVSIMTLILGILLFVCIAKTQLPWVDVNDSVYNTTLSAGGLRWFIKEKVYILYYVFYGLQFGLLTASLSVLAAGVSLYLSNRLLVLSVPIMAFHVITFYSASLFNGNKKMDLYYIFNGITNVWDNDMLSYLYAIAVGAASNIVLYKLISRKLKKRMQYE